MRYVVPILIALSLTPSLAACAAPSAVTLAAYERVTVGMTYEEVVAVMGKEGKEIVRTEHDGEIVTQCIWENSSGRSMLGQFRNGKLVAKTQNGLS